MGLGRLAISVMAGVLWGGSVLGFLSGPPTGARSEAARSVVRWSGSPPVRDAPKWESNAGQGRKPRDPAPSIRVINMNMNYWGKRRNFKRVMELLEGVEEQGLQPNIYTFNAVVNACVMCGCAEEVTRELWQRMVNAGLKPNAITYNTLLKMHFGGKGPAARRRAMRLLDEMEAQGIEPDTLTFNELINICVEGGDMASAARLLQNMSQRGLSPDVMTFTTLIKGYGRTGNLTSAFDCVREMREREVPLTVASCNALADACIRCGQPARALKLFRDFLLNGGAPLELRSYNIMIKAHREMGQLEGALSCMRDMREAGLSPDLVTFNTIVDAYCKAHRTEEARALIEEMREQGFKVDYQTLHPVLREEIGQRSAGLESSMDMAEELLQQFGHSPNNATVCTVMEALTAMERPQGAIEAFIRYYSDKSSPTGLRPATTTAYNGLIKAYRAVAMQADPEDDMPPVRLLAFHPDKAPTEMRPKTPHDVLKAILPITSHLRRVAGSGSGVEQGPNSITYNVLMDFAAELGKASALEAVMEERRQAGLRVDHYVIHSRMKCHAMRGDLAGVTQAKEDMETGGVASNERTFSVLVLSLLQCGQTHKAELLLRNALSRRLYIHDSLFMAFLRHYAAAQDLQGVQDVFQAYCDRVKKRTTAPVWNALLRALAVMNQLPLVEEAFEQMQQASVPPTGTTYMALIRAACVSRDLPRAMHWLRQMRSRRLAAPVRVFNWLIYACINAGDTATLVEVLRGMERDQVEPNRVTLRAKDHIIRLLATRMQLVSSSMLSRLSQAIDKAQQA